MAWQTSKIAATIHVYARYSFKVLCKTAVITYMYMCEYKWRASLARQTTQTYGVSVKKGSVRRMFVPDTRHTSIHEWMFPPCIVTSVMSVVCMQDSGTFGFHARTQPCLWVRVGAVLLMYVCVMIYKSIWQTVTYMYVSMVNLILQWHFEQFSYELGMLHYRIVLCEDICMSATRSVSTLWLHAYIYASWQVDLYSLSICIWTCRTGC